MENKKSCQNCRQNFVIDQQDQDFYQHMDVPAPRFCPKCRFQKRLMFRNERVLYKRNCDFCGKSMVTIHAPEKKLIVYCPECWWSDKWDDGAFYLDYDPNKHIFEQMKELQKITPQMGLVTDYATLINTDYANHLGSCKNCYLIFNADFNENVAYSSVVIRTKDSMDVQLCADGELLYECVNISSYNCAFSHTIEKCTDVLFSRYMIGCNNCFGCVNMRGKSYHIFNEPFSKEEYFKKLKEFRLDTWSGLQQAKKMAKEFWLKHPYRYMEGSLQNVNSTGDYVFYAKNALNCFQVNEIEDSRYCQFITMKPVKDCYDLTEWGNGAERVVDSVTVGEGGSNIKYCAGAWQISNNVEYAMYNVGCSNTFACINLKKKKYRILNKQYMPDEYAVQISKIKSQMSKDGEYGDFLPYDLSPFAYNESQAIQYFPLTKEEVLAKGWKWRDPTPSKHKVTMTNDQIPDSIHDVKDSILDEILGCGTCGKAFRLIRMELGLLRKWGFPIPRHCPDCRHMARLSQINPPRLYDRQCMKCQAPIQTSFAPARPEIVYCATCYANIIQ